MDESSPDILKRLRNQPPYSDVPPEVPVPEPKPEVPVETPVETPEEPAEEPAEEEVSEEVPEETPEETPENPEEDDITEEEALANSKNPERTKKYIEKLKAKATPPPAPVVPETPKTQLPNALDATEPEVMVTNPEFIPPVVSTQVPMPKEFATPKNYPNLNQKSIDDIMNSLITTDEEGNQLVDIDKLRTTLAEANNNVVVAHSEAQEAKKIAQGVERKFEDFEKTKEVQTVHTAFPELDPESGVFNEKYYDAVVSEMYVQLVKTGRRDFGAAASKWASTFRKEAEDVTKKEKEKVNKVVDAKKQINATGSHVNAQQRSTWNSKEDLVIATRKNVKGSLAARLEKNGY